MDPVRADMGAKRSRSDGPSPVGARPTIEVADVEVRIGSRWDDFVGIWKQWAALASQPGQDGRSRPEFCVPCWAEAPQGSGHVAQAWHDGELVAIAPLWSRRIGLIRTLRPIGAGPVSRASLVVKPGYDQAAEVLLDHLLNSHCVELDGLGNALRAAMPRHATAAAPLTSSFRADEIVAAVTVPSAQVSVIDDADDSLLSSLTLGSWVAEKDSQWPLALVQTAVDVVVRSGAGFVVADEGNGAAMWIVGGGEMTLLCAAGTCRPGHERWAASLRVAAVTAQERGVAIGHLPVPPLTTANANLSALPIRPARGQTVLAANSGVRLAALKLQSKRSVDSAERLAS